MKKNFGTESAEFTGRNTKLLALVAKTENPVGKPCVDGAANLVEFAGKEMIDTLDDSEMVAAGQRGNEGFDFRNGAVFVVSSVHK